VSGANGFAVGIDLGTTNSVIAYVEGDEIRFVPDQDGRTLHPSVVAFKPNGERLVGLKARLRRLVDPENTIFSAKRLIGQPFSSPKVQQAIRKLPYSVRGGDNDESVVVTRGGEFPVIDVSAFILEHLKQTAEAHLGRAVTHAVITVPAHFNDGQRQATRNAAERAGWQVLRILNEPTAAALAHGMGRGLDQRIVVFDMGGGTFDVTVLGIRDNLFEVIATGGDPYLGGDDMDRAVADILVHSFHQAHGIDLHEHRHAIAKAVIAAEQIKMQLSAKDEVEGSISELHYGEGGVPLPLDFRIDRPQFEKSIAKLVGRAMLTVDGVLSAAQLTPQLVDEVVLVGGSTRVPMVRRRVVELFDRQPLEQVNPMMAVAAGAAIQADLLLNPPAEAASAPLLMDVTAHALGVGTAGGYTDQLIDRNTPIPVERTRVFTTSSDYQTQVDIKVCEGEEKRFDSNHFLGLLHLEGLKPAPRGATRIEVTFLLDADGILQVAARDAGTGRQEQARLRVQGVGSVPATGAGT
jgi:molecular chaperone DnaK